MKIYSISLLASLCACLIFTQFLEARINVFEPWYPGQDTLIAESHSHQRIVSMGVGEHLVEIPFQFTYVTNSKMEMGGRWGLKSVNNKNGLNDLLLGLKCLFTAETELAPAVFGEAAVSLPTGSYSQGLGTGALGLLLHWALEKNIQPETTVSFGLGLRINSENGDKIQEGNVFYYHIGASRPYKNNSRLTGELKGFNHGWAKANGVNITNTYQELYLAPGIQFPWKTSRTVSASALIGLTPESHDLGLFLGCIF